MDDGYSYLVIISAAAACIGIAAYFIWKYYQLKAESVTEEGIMTMVNEGHEQGVLERSEAEMITNIFELGDKVAGDIMTNRKNIIALDGAMTVAEAAHFVVSEGSNSRYPVFNKDMDDIIGTLHIRDILVSGENPDYKHASLSSLPGLLREPHFILETRSIAALFKEMKSRKNHMEIVIDEYGQTVGLVTMEDILEEIVGNIMDEYDEDEEFIAVTEEGTWIMQGLAPLKEVERALGIHFLEEDLDMYDTINGLLISRLGRIPQEGEQPRVCYMGHLFEVLTVENKRIESVRVTPGDEPELQEQTEFLESAVSLE